MAAIEPCALNSLVALVFVSVFVKENLGVKGGLLVEQAYRAPLDKGSLQCPEDITGDVQ